MVLTLRRLSLLNDKFWTQPLRFAGGSHYLQASIYRLRFRFISSDKKVVWNSKIVLGRKMFWSNFSKAFERRSKTNKSNKIEIFSKNKFPAQRQIRRLLRRRHCDAVTLGASLLFRQVGWILSQGVCQGRLILSHSWKECLASWR